MNFSKIIRRKVVRHKVSEFKRAIYQREKQIMELSQRLAKEKNKTESMKQDFRDLVEYMDGGGEIRKNTVFYHGIKLKC